LLILLAENVDKPVV